MDHRAHVERVRRLARSHGLRLVKSRTRTVSARVFGTYGLIDPYHNVWIAYAGGDGYGLNLDDVEAWLRD